MTLSVRKRTCAPLLRSSNACLLFSHMRLAKASLCHQNSVAALLQIIYQLGLQGPQGLSVARLRRYSSARQQRKQQFNNIGAPVSLAQSGTGILAQLPGSHSLPLNLFGTGGSSSSSSSSNSSSNNSSSSSTEQCFNLKWLQANNAGADPGLAEQLSV